MFLSILMIFGYIEFFSLHIITTRPFQIFKNTVTLLYYIIYFLSI